MHNIRLIWLFLLSTLYLDAEAINLKAAHKLTKEELLELDAEVTNYYDDDFISISNRNVSFDEELFRSLRSIRHTQIIHLSDFKYSSVEKMRAAVGRKVDRETCLRELEVLVGLSSRMSENFSHTPLDVVNFLASAGKVEAGVLNGNFIWSGSASSCQRARISQEHLLEQLNSSQRAAYLERASERGQQMDGLEGRYCIAHMKSRSWPDSDKYFEDRLTIKLGVCIPKSCHSLAFEESAEVRRLTDQLARKNLEQPFNSDGYQIVSLFCLPDRDSPMRQWSLSTWLFVSFVLVWVISLAYLNLKYEKLKKTVRKLRRTVDIKMKVNHWKSSTDCQDELAIARPESPGELLPARAIEVSESNTKSKEEEGTSSEYTTDVGSELAKRAPKAPEGGFDLVRAFSLEANLSYLFGRSNKELGEDRLSQQQQQVAAGSKEMHYMEPSKHQVILASSRTGYSNEALMKELKEINYTEERLQAPVSRRGAPGSEPKRINLAVFDGFKAFATCYVVYGHTLMVFVGIASNFRFIQEWLLDWTFISVLNALQMVSLFYIITGILAGYLAFSRAKPSQLLRPSFWLLVIVSRYLRLIGPYLLVFWFARDVAPLTGDGPNWIDHRTDSELPRTFCSEQSWSSLFLMSAADSKITYDCVPQAWYLSVDMRTLAVIPVYLVVLTLDTAAGYLAMLATILYSFQRLYSSLVASSVDFTILLLWRPHMMSIFNDRLHSIYTKLDTRIGTYVLGLIAGHLLYLYEQRRIRDWPPWFRSYGMKFACLTFIAIYFSAYILSSPLLKPLLPAVEKLDARWAVLLVPIFKVLVELSMVVALMLVATGGGPKWIRWLLSSRAAKVMSQVSYMVFLTHVEVMLKCPSYKIELHSYHLWHSACSFISQSYLVAIVLHVIFEMPINNILRQLFKKLAKTLLQSK